MNENQTYIFGRNSIIEALSAGRPLERIFISYGSQGAPVRDILSKARRLKVPCVTMDKRKFAALEKTVCSTGAKSQGVIALLELIETITIDELIENSIEKTKFPILVALDQISDPHNLGAIARTAECAGAAGLIITERGSSPITPVALKASAGALQHLPVAKTSSLIQSFIKLKEAGYWIIGTDAKADKLYTDNIYDRPVVIVIGSEGKGLSPALIKHCDILIKIPLAGKVSSLNASVSAAVVLFEAMRQRG